MDFSTNAAPVCLLLDNGSVRPAATLELRRIARDLTARIGRPVEPVSLLHSHRVPAADLEGRGAEIFVDAVRQRWAGGTRRFLILPLFFGPSGAITSYLPQQVKALAAELGSLDVDISDPVAGRNPARPDPRLARILADHVRACGKCRRLSQPVVVLVDHGSPQRAVAEVRDRVAQQVAEELGPAGRAVVAASMERRDGTEFDFNEPLLERALTSPPCGAGAGDVVVAPMFFSPGRHAGPGGDIESIVRDAEARHAGLRVHLTRLVGEHPLLIDVLADRYRDAQMQAGA